ncbi:MAG: DUF4065 domain-containing protein [Arcobacter sp.]|nr:DUF4065 domain-containing protein [Arcobacter sp.]
MKIDITKIANTILYMMDNKVLHLNDRKLSILLFLMEFNHLENCQEKLFNETYLKTNRNPEPVILADLFDIIANNLDLDEDDERLILITELLDYLDIEIIAKENYIELEFIKMDEEFDETLFTKDEIKTINKVISNHKEDTARKVANSCFKIDKVRETKLNDIII